MSEEDGQWEIIQLATVVLTHIRATDGTRGILLELHCHPDLGPKPPVRAAMTESQALDLSKKLAEIVSLPRDGTASKERPN